MHYGLSLQQSNLLHITHSLETSLITLIRMMLSRLSVTIPSTTASVERSFSTMNQLESSERGTFDEKCLEDLLIISSEKQLLQEIRQDNTFVVKVIDLFVQKERTITLKYKQ